MEPFNSNLTQKETPRVLESPTDELDEELRKSAKQGEHNRDQTFKNHVNLVALIGLWGVVIAVMLCGVFYLYHMSSPEHCHFLSTNQLEQIRTFVVTAILSSSLTNYANRHINEE